MSIQVLSEPAPASDDYRTLPDPSNKSSLSECVRYPQVVYPIELSGSSGESYSFEASSVKSSKMKSFRPKPTIDRRCTC